MSLRPANSMDAGAIGAILSEFIDTTAWMPRVHTRAEDLAHAARMIELGWVTVALQNEQIVGFAARDGRELNSLYVSQSARDHGVGTALLEHAKTDVNTLDLWTFQANSGAQRFYQRHGFSEMSRTDGAGNDEKLPDIQLVWHRKDI